MGGGDYTLSGRFKHYREGDFLPVCLIPQPAAAFPSSPFPSKSKTKKEKRSASQENTAADDESFAVKSQRAALKFSLSDRGGRVDANGLLGYSDELVGYAARSRIMYPVSLLKVEETGAEKCDA